MTRSVLNALLRRPRGLGQNFLRSAKVADLIVHSAGARPGDLIFEIGTGLGILSARLARTGATVLSCEIDKDLFDRASESLSNYPNLELKLGDAFRPPLSETDFDICITSLPFSRSLDFVEWLSKTAATFRSAVAVLQTEFARKLAATPGTHDYRAVSVIAQCSFSMEALAKVERNAFVPRPNVRSDVVRFMWRAGAPRPFFNNERILSLKKIFSQRGRLLRTALKTLEVGAMLSVDQASIPQVLLEQRTEKLRPNDFLKILEQC